MKILKYIKFIFCLTIIVSMVAPSYAALSSTDGSAFVTKAEYASVISDVNERLTTFEAGINSKIDSQITSYLDRNGIWGGKKQTINPSFECYAKLRSVAAMVNATAQSFMGYGGNTSLHCKIEYDKCNPCTLLNNVGESNTKAVNKSGLLYLEYDMVTACVFGHAVERTGVGNGIRIACTNNLNHVLEHDDWMEIIFIIKNNNGVEKYRHRIAKKILTATTLVLEPTETIFSHFFVEAGEELTVESQWNLGTNSFVVWDNADEYWQKTFKPISIYVY